jgi:hypothetical protein
VTRLANHAKSLDALTFSIEELLRKVLAGKLRMPHFQRPLLWKAEDVELLFDSILNEFPIGTLLFWEKEAPADIVNWGTSWLQEVVADPRAWLVIDGQHRIATLALSLLQPPRSVWGADARFAWYWDVRKQEFCRRTGRGDEPPPHWLPMHCVGDMVRLMDWGDAFRVAGGTREEVESTRKWARRILDYKLNASVVQTDSEEVARAIYDRANSTGKHLDVEDVFKGLYGAAAGGTDALSEAGEMVRELGFPDLPREWVLKALLAIEGKNLTQLGASVHELEAVQVAIRLPEVAVALSRTIAFLRDDCGVLATALVPYELPIAVLARFFHLFPQPQPRSLILLRRWFWRGCVHEAFAAGDRSKVRHLVATVATDEEESVQRLLQLVPSEAAGIELDDFNARPAKGRILITVLAHGLPRDLRTGALLDLTELLTEAAGSVVEMRLCTSSRTAPEMFRSAANRLLHPLLPRAEFVKHLAVASREALASHWLTPDDAYAVTHGASLTALRARSTRVRAAAREFIDSRAEWGQSDRPSIAFLAAEPDSGEAA